ncbi:MAG: long-chain fatty acid--CoA ligase [Bacteroidetes bacterium]|nr:long-chain fatty acid--CoA ligase [Bacteroidota bacterium]
MKPQNDSLTINWIQKWANYSPKAIALVDEEAGLSMSYSELAKVVAFYAIKLKSYGLQKGDRLAILSPNKIEFIYLFLASQQLGIILVPLNFRLTPSEISGLIHDCEPSIWVLDSVFEEYVIDAEFTGKVILFHELSLWTKEALEQSKIKETEIEGDFTSVCMILYTSGTTGKPKGAQITNSMLFWNSVNTGLRLNLTQDDCSFIHAPFFHTGGWNVLTTPLFHRGAKLIFVSKFNADKLLERCEKYKATIIWGVPTMMDMLSKSEKFEKSDLSSIRYAVVGGEPMPIRLIEIWQEKGVPIRQGYGLTEFGPNVFSLNEEDAIRKRGSIGFPNFYIDTKVMKENGVECKANEDGELWLSGPVCTPGYWNNPQATEDAIELGWFKTGDIVRFDDEGYFYVVDRKKDLFISGGENVYPAEIERVIHQMPQVHEVAVIGVADEIWGEVGKAFIVFDSRKAESLSQEEVLIHCRHHLAKYKVPKYVEFIAELPKTDSGKILKRKLKHKQ